MNAFRCLRTIARPSTSTSTLLRPQVSKPLLQSRSISLLIPRRPILPSYSTPTALTSVPQLSSHLPLASESALDLAGKISAHPALGGLGMQIRCGPRDTYNPSHLVRKRRHGFLSRIRTKKGRKLLMRRLKKGRWNLSH